MQRQQVARQEVVIMTFEEKKEYLNQYRTAEAEVKYFKRRIEQYKKSKLQAGVQKLSDMPFVSGNGTDLSDYIVKIEEMEGEVISKMIRALSIMNDIINWIETLADPREKLVLKYRYIDGKTVAWMAEEMEKSPISEKTVKRILKNAIKNLQDVPKCP